MLLEGATPDEQKNFKVAKMKIFFGWDLCDVSLDNFQGSWQQPGESFAVLVHDLKQLLEHMMPDTQGTTHGQLLRHHFLTGLHSQVSKQLRAAVEMTTWIKWWNE